MRVIAGELRGKKLLAPGDETIRPTTDRVKESMFNLIYDYIYEDTVVYDLFSGTGGLGIEALSRGAARAFFSDKSKDSYNITKENIRSCRMEERSHLVFLDPPYALDLWKESSDFLISQDKLNEDAIIVMEHPSNKSLEGIDSALRLVKERKYGVIMVSIYQYNTDWREEK